MTLILFLLMVVLFALGTPVAWSMAIASIVYSVVWLGIPLQGMVQRMVGGLDSFPLLAIPFFILAGNLMNTGGITDRLVTFAKVMVGHVTGGLAHVTVVANMIMAGMSGSAMADAAGTGTILVPAMRKAGYGRSFPVAIVSAAATIGPIIPPSIPFVIFGSVANVSIGRLFLGGAITGVVMGLIMMVFAYFIAKHRQYPKEARASLQELGWATLSALPPLGMPAIILGGMLAGIMTPTEAAVAGTFYAFFLGCFIYREISASKLWELIVDSALGSAAVLIILGAAQPMGWILAFEQAPQAVVEFFAGQHLAKWEILAILNIIMLIVGCFMEGIAILIMATPMIMPLVQQAGIDPVHFGVVFVLNIQIGAITPPVGMILFTMIALGKISVWEFTKEIWPFFIALGIALVLTTYIEPISMWLPNLLMPVR